MGSHLFDRLFGRRSAGHADYRQGDGHHGRREGLRVSEPAFPPQRSGSAEPTRVLVCPGCRSENAPGARFCGNCGQGLSVLEAACSKCGFTLSASARFCSSCGAPAQG